MRKACVEAQGDALDGALVLIKHIVKNWGIISQIKGNILTPKGFINGTITCVDGLITRIEGNSLDENVVRESSDSLVLPGFIDTHVHGGGGVDVMEGGAAIQHITRLHATYGTTSLLATTMTALEDVKITQSINTSHKKFNKRSFQSIGHSFGSRFINTNQLGAQPNYVIPAALEQIAVLHRIVPIRVMTLASEYADNIQVIKSLTNMGIRVQLGHTLATYEQAVSALHEGACGFTHLYNAMGHFHHRKPGVVGAALAHAKYSEIIPDLLHVHQGAIRVALRAIPHLFCVTDSTAASGMPDGSIRLGRQIVRKCLGGVRLEDGTLAGSTLTMDQAFRNFIKKLVWVFVKPRKERQLLLLII